MAQETRKDCQPRQAASLENAIAGWKVFLPVRLLARGDSRTIWGLMLKIFSAGPRQLRAQQ